MLDRTKARFGIKPKRLAADTAYGTGKFLGWLADQEIEPLIPVWDKGSWDDGTFGRTSGAWLGWRRQHQLERPRAAKARRPEKPPLTPSAVRLGNLDAQSIEFFNGIRH
jgi:hypothetical protein